MITIRFYIDEDPGEARQLGERMGEPGGFLHETRCPLGAPIPGEGEAVTVRNDLWEVTGRAFNYEDPNAPVVILRVTMP